MSEWKTYKLGEICSKIGSGSTPRGGKEAYFETEEYSLIRSQNVLDFSFSKNGLAFISEEQAKELRNVTIERDDILLNITGDSVARVCQVPDEILPARVNQHVAIIRGNSSVINQKYLKYFLLEPSFKGYMLGMSSSGATRNALTKVMIENFVIKLPDLTTQTQIAQILTSLDDKIELNLQMNQTLEAMAQALFKEWCSVESDILPKAWAWKELAEIAEVSSSKRIFREEYVLNGIPFYRGKEITQLSNGNSISTELFISNERYKEIKKRFGVPQIGEILITSVGTIGSVWLVDNDSPFYFKDGNVTWIKNYKTEIKGEFIYQWLQTKDAKEQIKSVTIGSTQEALTISALKGLKILIPDRKTIINITHQLEKFNLKRINNLLQIQTLTQTRDTLLPKLMSGAINVN